MSEAIPELPDLFRAMRPRVRFLARRFSALAPRSVAYEDLVQEGEIAIWRCLGTYRAMPGATFSTYATHRLRGAMIDFIRNQSLGPRGSLVVTESWDQEDFERGAGTMPSVLDDLLERERVEQVVLAWQSLPRREREVLSAFYSDDRQLDDIATDYGISPSRVSQIRKTGERRVRARIRRVS